MENKKKLMGFLGTMIAIMFCMTGFTEVQGRDLLFVKDPAVQLTESALPSVVITRDLNGDHKEDLVVSNAGNGTISVLLSLGNGTFEMRKPIVVGVEPQGLALGLINGDDILDLVVTDTLLDIVTVMHGDGCGGFTKVQALGETGEVGQYPHGVALGDLNEDTFLDLAVASHDSDRVYVLFGKRNGIFDTGSVAEYLGDEQDKRGCQSVHLSKINQDMHLDMVVGNLKTDYVSVLLGNGDGTFQTAVHSTAGQGTGRIILAELDSLSGNMDLIVSNEEDNENDITILKGNGDGTFHILTTYSTGHRPVALVFEDFTQDGRKDLAVAHYGKFVVSSNEVSSNDLDITLLIGHDDGTFDESQTKRFRGGQQVWGMVSTDLNGDHIPDLAVASHADSKINLLINQSSPAKLE